METFIAILIVLMSLAGIALTLLTLPGIWFAILCAGLAQWWHMSRYGGEQMFSWWTLGVCLVLAFVGELVDLFASAAGTAKVGGTRRGAIGSVIGGLVGAIAGSFIVPILGTIIGAVTGAGLGALAFERHGGRKTWSEATKIGTGAAVGRLAATFMKTWIAAIVATILSVAAFV